jgi:hypothetical protein
MMGYSYEQRMAVLVDCTSYAVAADGKFIGIEERSWT